MSAKCPDYLALSLYFHGHMPTCSEAFYELLRGLQPLYDEREAAGIAHEILYYITGFSKMQRLMQRDVQLSGEQLKQYNRALQELGRGTPVQYVTGSAWFMGREFHVNKYVLIPRPETEELVEWIATDYAGAANELTILDIGTGSGCIAISVKLRLPATDVAACDISKDALAVATENAQRLGAAVSLIQADFLDLAEHNKFGAYDVIVSNPPYIPVTEKEKLHTNVRDHEPALALFVPADDALLFYRRIALFGKKHLSGNGYIYCELDAEHALACKALFEDAGYHPVEIRKDMHGNWRMLKAKKHT
jgi:release factor glutamine methyltransferase